MSAIIATRSAQSCTKSTNDCVTLCDEYPCISPTQAGRCKDICDRLPAKSTSFFSLVSRRLSPALNRRIIHSTGAGRLLIAVSRAHFWIASVIPFSMSRISTDSQAVPRISALALICCSFSNKVGFPSARVNPYSNATLLNKEIHHCFAGFVQVPSMTTLVRSVRELL